jgi:predicted ATPase
MMLTSLEIKNFRMLENFQVDKLGRINLIVGKNNSGKSTVLEALRIYAGNAQRGLLEEIAAGHDETYGMQESEQGFSDDGLLPFQDFFTGRKFPDRNNPIVIGPTNPGDDALRISHVYLQETEETVTDESGETRTRIRRRPIPKPSRPELMDPAVSQALRVTKSGQVFFVSLDTPGPSRFRSRMVPGFLGSKPCSVIPTQFISIDELADEWDRIVFTEQEDVVRQALRIIADDFESLTFIRYEGPSFPRRELRRTAKVKLAGLPRPVPLNSLGDGMLRVLQLILKAFPAKGGVLLIDEFENGLHYSVQEKVWALLFDLAQRLDIQVFATTHSWDCVESFAKVAELKNDIEGILFRVGKSARTSDKDRVIATVFDRDALRSITQADVEVR